MADSPLHLPDSTALTPWLARLKRVGKGLAISLCVLVVMIGLSLITFTVLMARVPGYRAQMQTWLSTQAKLDIQFANVSAGWRGYGPELRFTQAQIRSADKQRVLALADKGSVGFDLWQALRTWRLGAARFSLQGTELKVQRLANGQFELVGQADWPEYESDQSFKLDSLPVGELNLTQVSISFRDLKTGRGPWLLEQVALRVTRDIVADEDVLSLHATATLPKSLGQTLKVTATARGALKQVEQLRWRAQLQASRFDLHGWERVFLKGAQARDHGVGSFKLQAAFTGLTPQEFAGELRFDHVQLALPVWRTPLPLADPLVVRKADDEAVIKDKVADKDATTAPQAAAATSHALLSAAPQEYRQVDLAFASKLTAEGWHTRVQRLHLATPTHDWSSGDAQLLLAFDPEQPARISRAQGHVDHLVLDTLWPLLAFLPDNQRNARLRALNLSGQIKQLSFNYVHEANQPPRYGVRAEMVDIGVSPVGKGLGVSGLSGVLRATGARGQFKVDSRDLELAMPRIFRTPLPADAVSAQLAWTRDASGVHVRGEDIHVHNADGRAQASFTLDIPQGDASPVIDLQATGDELNAAAAPRYMPAGVMREDALAWLDGAFTQGTVRHAQAQLRGPLKSFPFRDKKGLFLITAQIDDLTLNYHPDYLPATKLMVAAEFRNAGLRATASAGDVNGLALMQAEGSIADFRVNEVRVKARLKGGLAAGLDYVQRSPVGPKLGGLFQQLSGDGQLQANAELFLPLRDMAHYRFDLDAALQGSTLAAKEVDETITNLAGKLHVRNDAMTAATLSGNFLQGSFTARAEPATRGQYNIVVLGNAQADGVRRLLSLPTWLQLSGATDYRFTLPGYAASDARGVRHLYSVDSDLKGLGIALPEPAGKSAESVRSFHLDADLPRGDVMQLRGALGSLRALVQLRQANDRWRFDRAGLRADGLSAALPAAAGLRVEGQLNQLVLDEWLKLGDGAMPARRSSDRPLRVQEVLKSANVTINNFRLYGFYWPQVRGILQATDAGWRVDVAGEHASGQLLVPYSFDAAKPLTLNMDELHMQTMPDKSSNAATASNTRLDPRELPSIQAQIKHFRFDEHDFGALQVTATRTPKGLMLNDARISGDSFNGSGSGSWLKTPDGSLSAITLTIESNDVRDTMQRFNYGDFITGKRGKLLANLSWPDGVDADLLGRASGSMEFQLNDGQLLSLQPGAGRVLGLLSVAALPRRLGLDFRDLTDKGLAYDTIHADFTITKGDARTQNLVLRGPAMEVGIVGRMGLGVRDYDQTAVVTGEVGNALPVAGTAIGGPVVGAALLLFTKVFQEPLKGVARAYYHIGGTWEDPKVERIDADAAKAAEAINTEGKTP